VLYGIHFAKKSIIQNERCYLVEGYTDVLSMHQAGIENVVASSGTALTPDQIRLIKRFTPNITVLYDGDAAGIKAALRGIDLVLEEGLNVKVVLLPDGEDPDSFAHKHSATEFYDFIKANETDFISFKTKLLLSDVQGDPVKKANLISDIVRTIAIIPDTITRALYVKECSTLMQVDEKILHGEINKILYKAREKTWNREQPAPINPSGEPLNLQLPISNKFEIFEKEILRLLLNYSKKVLFTIAGSDENAEESINTAGYICRELEGEIEIKSPQYKIIFDEFKDQLYNGNLLDSTHFINHPNHIISTAAADLLSEGHQISKMWSKKGTYINTEEDNLKSVIDNAISGYKYELVLNILNDIEKELKELSNLPDMEEKLNELYEKYMLYTQFKIEISKSLGERIILRR
jgi:DNA primase